MIFNIIKNYLTNDFENLVMEVAESVSTVTKS